VAVPPTVKFTWKDTLPEAVVTATVPVYVPDERPVAFAVTVTLPVRLELVACSQLWPVLVVAVTLVIAMEDPLNVMATFCAGAVPPTATLKLTGFGVATSPDVPPVPNVSVTGALTPPPAVVNRFSVPVYVPCCDATLFTVKVTVPSVLTATLTNVNPGSVGVNVAWDIDCWTLLSVTVTFCGGAEAGADSVNVIGLGFTISPLPVVPVPTVRLTWKVTVPDRVFTVTVPV
jgi:hypothetical protein